MRPDPDASFRHGVRGIAGRGPDSRVEETGAVQSAGDRVALIGVHGDAVTVLSNASKGNTG